VPGEPLGVCGAVLMVLERIGNERAEVVSLVNLLLSDDDARVRSLAARALSTVGKAEAAVPALVKALKEDSNQKVQTRAVWALGRRGPQAKEALVPLMDLLTTQLAKPKGESWDLTLNIIQTIGTLGLEGKPAVSRLAMITIDGRYSADLRSRAAEALGKIGHATPDVLEALRIASESTDDPVSTAAKTSLAALTGKKDK
jgi:HEAT repeat protein